MLIDSHVNFHAPQFADDQAEVIARARAAGVGLMITICDKLASFETIASLAQTHADIWCTVGVHPHEAKDYVDLTPQTLIALGAHPRVVGIGECGLDYHYDLSPRDIQRQVFAAHIAAAQATGLPLVVHTREADEDMGEMLERAFAERPFKLLMHCYTSGADLAVRAAALGAWFSVSGIATFKGADEVRAVIAEMPGDRILLETDCPYLAPVPHRGRRNEPAYLPHIAAKLAQIRGWSLEETEARTTAAVYNLFHRIDKPLSELS
jgi:TatD DNase family protein